MYNENYAALPGYGLMHNNNNNNNINNNRRKKMHGGANKEKIKMINMLHNKYLIHKKTVFSGF